MTGRSSLLGALVLGLVLAGCQSAVSTAGPVLQPGETRLVIQGASSSRALDLAAANYVTLQLTSADGRQTLFASSSGQGTGTYTLTVSGLVSGDWALKVRFYASPSSSTLVYYANLTHYLAAGQSNPVTVALYQPAAIDGLGVTEAKAADQVGVFNLAGGSWSTTRFQSLVVGQTHPLGSEVLAADDTLASDQRVVWSSSDETVLNVDSRGVVTGVRPGTANLKVTTVVGKVSATFPVVVDVDLVGIWEADFEDNLAVIHRVAMLDVHRNSAGDLEGTLWAGLDTGTTVDGHSENIGPVLPLGHFTFLFLAKTSSLNDHGPTWTSPVPEADPIPSTLTVISPDTLAFNGSDRWEFRRSHLRIDSLASPLPPVAVKPVTVNTNLDLGIYTEFDSPSPGGFLWSSSDTNVASVDVNGLVTFHAVGTASIRAHATDGPDRVFKVNFEVRPLL